MGYVIGNIFYLKYVDNVYSRSKDHTPWGPL